ncbi:AraC family transcriptional regulator [Reichenbachiella carrageenanivorans]|uniref:AraC family transcriptional regulator n=1 Tax=Reichenbachiella carrageenanivorans TaxID=2979869 RepID=A0ABY6CVD7_9BACT|nr:AraC family transcriptional regulator [Reichenbachiella carrageenanivorans]UXX77872.1 AraC family transcriptional regulator [Reichenbachiella carrageenanivorans]
MKAVLEQVAITEQQSIRAFRYSKKGFDAPWHFHPEYELTWVVKSTGIRYVGNNISDFSEGDLVMLGSNLPHCWKNGEEHTGESESVVIQWRRDLIGDLPVFKHIHELMDRCQRGLCIHLADREDIVSRIQKVLVVDGLHQYLQFVELLDYMASHARYDYIAGASYSYDGTSATTSRLETVQSYVKDHYKDKIKLSEVAEKLSMSEQAFSRFFSKTMSKPFFVFLNEYRVNISSRLILETDLQMAEIAYQCGYESLPFFYKQFKKFKGYTPLEFRKMYWRI